MWCEVSAQVNAALRTASRHKPISEIVRVLDTATVSGNAATVINGIEYDSRQVTAGDLFAALTGADFDGHAFADRAVASGAAALLVEHTLDVDVPQIVVPDSRAALARVAAAFYDYPSREMVCIGVTGTDGKTTTTHLIDGILRHAGQKTGLIGTVGIRIGDAAAHELPHQTTPESNLLQRYLREMVSAGVGVAVIETTSHGLAMHRLDTTRFTIAGVTNITHEHLEYHGTIDAYRRAKAMLLERVGAEHGIVVLNADDPGAMSIRDFAAGAEVLTYGIATQDADLRADRVVVDGNGSTFTLETDGISAKVHVPLIGAFNVANALCAIGVARAAGVPIDTSIAALAHTQGVPGRLESINAGQPYTVIVDYAHTPESIEKVLALLRDIGGNGRLIIVTGSAGERDRGKRPMQGRICATMADISIFTNEDPRNEDPEHILADIAAGAKAAGGTEGETFFRVADRRVAIAKAFELARPGDCVLLAGKGHERSIIVGYEHQPWNEAEVARSLLAERGFPGQGAMP